MGPDHEDWERRASRLVDTLTFATRELADLIAKYRADQDGDDQEGGDDDGNSVELG